MVKTNDNKKGYREIDRQFFLSSIEKKDSFLHSESCSLYEKLIRCLCYKRFVQYDCFVVNFVINSIANETNLLLILKKFHFKKKYYFKLK